MYLLTKENLVEARVREHCFTDLLASGYSGDAMYRYKRFYEAWELPKKKDRPVMVDLGYSLRHLLAAVTLKANTCGFKISAAVFGSGCFLLPYEWLAYQYLSLLRQAAILADGRAVETNARLSKQGMVLSISYFGTKVPPIALPFTGAIRGKRVQMHARLALPGVSEGCQKTVWYYLQDRFSPVNLVLLDHSEKAASTASATRMPSTADEVIPPAYPAPSPQG